jgi:hypothetical protein
MKVRLAHKEEKALGRREGSQSRNARDILLGLALYAYFYSARSDVQEIE